MKKTIVICVGIFVFMVFCGVMGYVTAKKFSEGKKCDCSYERFASDQHMFVSKMVLDSAEEMLLAVQEDMLVMCAAKLRHCGCLREEVPESFEH